MDKDLRCKWLQIYATYTPSLKNILQGVSANNREALWIWFQTTIIEQIIKGV